MANPPEAAPLGSNWSELLPRRLRQTQNPDASAQTFGKVSATPPTTTRDRAGYHLFHGPSASRRAPSRTPSCRGSLRGGRVLLHPPLLVLHALVTAGCSPGSPCVAAPPPGRPASRPTIRLELGNGSDIRYQGLRYVTMDSREDLVGKQRSSLIADRVMAGAANAPVATHRWTVSASGETGRHKGTIAVRGDRSIWTDPNRMSR